MILKNLHLETYLKNQCPQKHATSLKDSSLKPLEMPTSASGPKVKTASCTSEKNKTNKTPTHHIPTHIKHIPSKVFANSILQTKPRSFSYHDRLL